ncbi:MAG: hypothetical protein AAGI46_00320 [Planctomycetota bacterium]
MDAADSAALISPPKADGYSPPLRMSLEVAGRVFNVRETGPDFVVLSDAVDVDADFGVLHTVLDGVARERRIALIDGIRASRYEQSVRR